jgi:RNA polymerase sigma-70 factor (ECF subfamily)
VSPEPTTHAELFAAHRSLLFTVAYELLGSAADAEDVVQETWLRWASASLEEVREPRAYLARIAARLALNRVRTLARRRETYVGPWLPEPLLTAPDVADDVELAESVSTAMLMVLETLTPTERAVFVLREVFGFSYDEIAGAVEKSSAAVRQVAHRARSHVAARRPRASVTPAEHAAVYERFVAAAVDGDVQGLLDVLAPDVVLVTDGGGMRKAALRPIHGVEKVLRFLAAVAGDNPADRVEVASVNGAPALLMWAGGVLDSVANARVEDGLVTELYFVRNPAKLSRLSSVVSLAR